MSLVSKAASNDRRGPEGTTKNKPGMRTKLGATFAWVVNGRCVIQPSHESSALLSLGDLGAAGVARRQALRLSASYQSTLERLKAQSVEGGLCAA